MSSVHLKIIVVGGGIGGLSAALALRQQGHIVTVVESSSWLREAGAAVAVSPNATTALVQLGVDLQRDVRAAKLCVSKDYCFAGKYHVPEFGENGEGRPNFLAATAKALGVGDLYFMAHRVDLHEALKQKCLDRDGKGEPIKIILSSKVVAWDASGAIQLSDGTQMEADLVVAADGINSVAHEAILGHLAPANPSGITAMRFLLKTSDILANEAISSIMDDGPGAFVFYTTANGTAYLLRYACQRWVIICNSRTSLHL
jgi:salicylate hydroxylase